MLHALSDHWAALRSEWKKRRQLRQLLDKDDALLHDMGLTRHDVADALRLPYQRDAREEAERLSRLTLGMETGR
ncbi:MAG: DUF1127 domain-containing protein [Paracoccaceae bacterium]